MTRHSKIYGKLGKILSEEWRDDMDEIIDDLKKQKHDKEKYGFRKRAKRKRR